MRLTKSAIVARKHLTGRVRRAHPRPEAELLEGVDRLPSFLICLASAPQSVYRPVSVALVHPDAVVVVHATTLECLRKILRKRSRLVDELRVCRVTSSLVAGGFAGGAAGACRLRELRGSRHFLRSS